MRIKTFGILGVFLFIAAIAASSIAQTPVLNPKSPVTEQEIEIPPAPPKAVEPISLRIVAVGDVNLNRNLVEVLPEGSNVWGTIVPFDDFAVGIPGMIDGDVNFCNIETIITDRNNFPPMKKAFCFRTHPNGIRMILKNNFNLFSMANNHSYDYAATGVYETLKNLAILQKEYTFHWAGIGKNKAEAIRPAIFTIKGVKIGFTSLGIGHAATKSSPGVGQEYYYKEALSLLRDADVDVRILSCHDGKEGTSYPIDRQLRVYREAIDDYGVDLVFGHHPHVVQGVEHYSDGIIFYSLGNFMIRGAADMGKRPASKNVRDFGLLGRVDLKVVPGVGPTFDKIEIVPVYDMHQGPHPFADPEEAHIRIRTVNELSELSALNRARAGGISYSTAKSPIVFEAKDGKGVYVFPKSE